MSEPQYVLAFLGPDGAVVVDDFPSSDLVRTEQRARDLNDIHGRGEGAYRVAELRYVDEEG